jgi:hypothetical protein
MDKIARGTFDVKVTPLAVDPGAAPGLGRLALSKVFHGDLEGTGSGMMLTAMTETRGSAGYVAMERVTGSVHGRRGTFVFQHSGTMDRSVQTLSISVVPDSGTDELMGIAGQFKLEIVDGVHRYEFAYRLAEKGADA